jgi:FkbM family methyltransferase
MLRIAGARTITLEKFMRDCTDAAILAAFARKLDEIERTAPMTGGYERIDPRIVMHSQGSLTYRTIVYHRESEAWYGNSYFDWSIEHIQEAALLRASDTVLDIGCNAGLNAIMFATLVGPSGRVIAFDPYPWNAAATHFNAKLNGLSNIEVRACGIGGRNEIIRLSLSESRTTMTCVVGATINAPISALADLAPLRPNFIKLDCEGAEQEISATDFGEFADLRSIYMELHGPFIRERGLNPRDCLDRFHAQNFCIRIGHPRGPTYAPGVKFHEQSSFYMACEGRRSRVQRIP